MINVRTYNTLVTITLIIITCLISIACSGGDKHGLRTPSQFTLGLTQNDQRGSQYFVEEPTDTAPRPQEPLDIGYVPETLDEAMSRYADFLDKYVSESGLILHGLIRNDLSSTDEWASQHEAGRPAVFGAIDLINYAETHFDLSATIKENAKVAIASVINIYNAHAFKA